MRPVKKKLDKHSTWAENMDCMIIKTDQGFLKFEDVAVVDPVWGCTEMVWKKICQNLLTK